MFFCYKIGSKPIIQYSAKNESLIPQLYNEELGSSLPTSPLLVKNNYIFTDNITINYNCFNAQAYAAIWKALEYDRYFILK